MNTHTPVIGLDLMPNFILFGCPNEGAWLIQATERNQGKCTLAFEGVVSGLILAPGEVVVFENLKPAKLQVITEFPGDVVMGISFEGRVIAEEYKNEFIPSPEGGKP